jgi:hypothetical protein
MELLAVNKNLSYTIQDGMIVFDEGQVEGAVSAQQSAYIRAQATKYAGDQALMQAETDLMKRDLSRDLNSKADAG